MMIHKKFREISNDQDYSNSQKNLISKDSAVWMNRYEIFLIAGKGASGNLNHSRSLDDY